MEGIQLQVSVAQNLSLFVILLVLGKKLLNRILMKYFSLMFFVNLLQIDYGLFVLCKTILFNSLPNNSYNYFVQDCSVMSGFNSRSIGYMDNTLI